MPQVKEQTFEQKVQVFIRSLKNTKRHARNLSETALQTFAEHGDTSQLQMLLDVFQDHGKNFIRVTAFKKWMAAHAPITMNDGKLVKDKGENAVEMNLEKAKEMPFWEFAPEKEAFNFTADDLLKLVKGIIKRTENDKAKAVNQAATSVVVDLKKFVEDHTKVNQDLDDEADKAQAAAG